MLFRSVSQSRYALSKAVKSLPEFAVSIIAFDTLPLYLLFAVKQMVSCSPVASFITTRYGCDL